MVNSLSFKQNSLSFLQSKTYLWVAAFVAGNILLPQLCHFIPDGGKILLPIYFFTLIASYKYGLKAGLLTAVLSPIVNHLLFGMPMAVLLPVILAKSVLLAIVAAEVSRRSSKVSLLLLVAVVAGYQAVGSLVEWAITGSAAAALQDISLGLPGIAFQVVMGYVVLRLIRK